jgi:mRNA interferase HigB
MRDNKLVCLSCRDFMHLISITNLREDAARYPDAEEPLKNWFKTVENADWPNLNALQQSFSDAESVGNFTVFNIKGNHYRLIVGIDYQRQVIYYKYFLTHADYSKDKWKNDPYF